MKTHRTIKHAAPLAALALAFAFFSSGCSHSVAPTRQQFLPLSTTTDWHQSGFANPNNPYDTIGLQHNEGLNYIADRLGTVWNDDTLYPGTDTLGVLFIDSIYGISNDSMNSQLRHVRRSLTHVDSLMGLMPHEFGPQATGYYNSIDSIINSANSLSSKIDSIESIEAAAASTLSGSPLIFVQYIAAIARYSASYWSSSDTTKWTGWSGHQRAIVERIRPGKGAKTQGLWSFLGTDAAAAAVAAVDEDGIWFGGGPGVLYAGSVTLLTGICGSAFG